MVDISYEPNPVPENPEDFRRYINDELQNLRNYLNEVGDDVTILDIAEGKARGYSSVNKFGRCLDIATATYTDVWDYGGTVPVYPFPATATVLTLASIAADDIAGTGAQKVEVQGLDANWDLQTVTYDTNGGGTTVSTETWIRIFRMKVVQTGSGLENAGDITATVNANIIAQITNDGTIGFNQTLMAVYTVPRGKSAYLTGYKMSVNKKNGAAADFNLWARDNANSYPFQLKETMGMDSNATSTVQQFFIPQNKFTEKTDIKMQVLHTATGVIDSSVGFDLILVDNA